MLQAQIFSAVFVLQLLVAVDISHCQSGGDSSEETSGVPIIRQINKVNNDGTYTYGYEAADGSFKIETRDVLGNVKGMFGFIDESGDLKRVSYTANNETGFRNSIVHPSVSTTVRPSNLSRRPVLVLKDTPAVLSTTKGPVIQHIPKKLKDDEESSNDYMITHRRVANPTKNDTSADRDESNKFGTVNPLRKVLVSKRPVDEKEKETRGKGGNNLRRQLNRGLDLRGEMAHIYSGGEAHFSAALPPHLSALMSELRPIHVVRAAAPESIGYRTVDIEGASQEINETPHTTEVPYGTRRPPIAAATSANYISPRYQRPPPPPHPHPQPVPPPEETQYLQEVSPHYRYQRVLPPQGAVTPPLAIGLPNANYHSQPQYYDQPSPFIIPPTLRDELMAIIYNYLQVRLNHVSTANPYYPRPPYANPYVNSLFTPAYPYATPNYPNYPPVPYANPYLPVPPYYPPYDSHPHGYPVPTQTPAYSGPNVQFARHDQQIRHVPRGQSARSAAADDVDLLQMLLASPTRIPINQISHSSTTERSVGSKSGQPIRNLQIIRDTTELIPPGTSETPEN